QTNRTPTDWRSIQPRAQVSWDVRGDSRDLVRLGGGAFSAQPHYYLHANDIFFEGSQLGDLSLSGNAVPRPDFIGYRNGTTPIPGVPAGTTAPSYVNLISPDFQVPTTWKASLSYETRRGSRLELR